MFRRQLKQAIRKFSGNKYRTLNRIELNRAHVLHNVALLQKQHPDSSVILVLKGNAYGHGLEEMAQILNDADCSLLAVDGYFEAAKILAHTRHRILVMGYILPENVHLLDTKKCSFVVQDMAGLHAFGKLRRPVRVHLELNTGMNRLGLQPHELAEYLHALKQYPNLQLEGVMSHLADADNEIDDSYTTWQITLFDELVEKIYAAALRPKLIHIAQTAGTTKARSHCANGLRLGIGLYGINPLASNDSKYHELEKLRPVLELKSTIIKIIDLQKGDKVSYNGTFTAPARMRVAVLPLGYYEGVPRELSNKGCVTFAAEIFPIVGRVCMNHTMIAVADSNVHVGSEVTVISSDPAAPNSVPQICVRHALFNYSLLTGLSSSTRRLIV